MQYCGALTFPNTVDKIFIKCMGGWQDEEMLVSHRFWVAGSCVALQVLRSAGRPKTCVPDPMC